MRILLLFISFFLVNVSILCMEKNRIKKIGSLKEYALTVVVAYLEDNKNEIEYAQRMLPPILRGEVARIKGPHYGYRDVTKSTFSIAKKVQRDQWIPVYNPDHSENVARYIAFSYDDKMRVIATNDAVKIWDSKENKLLQELLFHKVKVTHLEFDENDTITAETLGGNDNYTQYTWKRIDYDALENPIREAFNQAQEASTHLIGETHKKRKLGK